MKKNSFTAEKLIKSNTAVKNSEKIEAFKQIPSFILCTSWKFKSPARKTEVWPWKHHLRRVLVTKTELRVCIFWNLRLFKGWINESRSFAKMHEIYNKCGHFLTCSNKILFSQIELEQKCIMFSFHALHWMMFKRWDCCSKQTFVRI